MGMRRRLFQAAEEFLPRGEAGFPMQVTLPFRQGTGQSSQKAFRAVDMGRVLVNADQHLRKTGIAVGMALRFLFFAGQDFFPAIIAVGVPLPFRFGADQFPDQAVFIVGVSRKLRLGTDKRLAQAVFVMTVPRRFRDLAAKNCLNTFFVVPMLPETAEGLSRQGDARQLKGPEHTQHDKKQKEHRHLPSDPAQCTPIQLYKDRSKTILQGFPFFLSVSRLSQPFEFRNRPELEQYLSDQMIRGNTADDAASAVDGGFPLVAHHEISVLRHLIRK